MDVHNSDGNWSRGFQIPIIQSLRRHPGNLILSCVQVFESLEQGTILTSCMVSIFQFGKLRSTMIEEQIFCTIHTTLLYAADVAS
jgi:hypothetical protein